MRPGLRLIESALEPRPSSVAAPILLITLDPWHRVFLSNLRDLFGRRRVRVKLSSRPDLFWSDVFVVSPLPWARFLESAIFHVAVIAALWSSAQLWPQRPHIIEQAVFHRSDVIYI